MKKNKSKPEAKEKKQYRSTFIDNNLCKTVRKNTALIKEALAQKGNQSILIGKYLCALEKQFELIAKKRKKQPGTASKAFKEYIQVQFDIGGNRASEYIQFAKVFDGLEINLEISKLVELSRLGQPALKKFLLKYPHKELASWSCRKVRDLVRESNPNKRVAKQSSKKKPKLGATNPEPSYNQKLQELAKNELPPAELFILAIEAMKNSVGSGPIPVEVIKQIELLVEWKSSKQLKVAG